MNQGLHRPLGYQTSFPQADAPLLLLVLLFLLPLLSRARIMREGLFIKRYATFIKRYAVSHQKVRRSLIKRYAENSGFPQVDCGKPVYARKRQCKPWNSRILPFDGNSAARML